MIFEYLRLGGSKVELLIGLDEFPFIVLSYYRIFTFSKFLNSIRFSVFLTISLLGLGGERGALNFIKF